jgi:hypothetical protein
MVVEPDGSGENAGGGIGAAPAPPELPANDGPEAVVATGRPYRDSRGFVDSKSFMMLLL